MTPNDQRRLLIVAALATLSPAAMRHVRKTGLARLGCVVRDLYAAGSGHGERIAARVDDAYVGSLAQAVAGELGGQGGVAPRGVLRQLVADGLDRVEELGDLDPPGHYALTLFGRGVTGGGR